ncbi:MAG: 50S ribosomal protein L15 [Candidatus Saccharimonadales bacterium]
MKYNELLAETNKDRKRVGRGISAGQGKTAGRGTKGQGARTGKKHGHMFMGGQGSIVRRTPKSRGFKSLRVPAQVVYLDQLSDVKGATITNETLYEAGLVATPFHSVKIIAARKDGVYTGKATVKVQGASASVVAALVKAGGAFEAVAVPNIPATNKERAAKKADKVQKAEKKSN